jgi:hypothetical protein
VNNLGARSNLSRPTSDYSEAFESSNNGRCPGPKQSRYRKLEIHLASQFAHCKPTGRDTLEQWSPSPTRFTS